MPVAFKAASTCTRHTDGTAEPSSPAGVSAGDYLLYFFSTNSGTEPSTPSTWEIVSDALVWFGGNWNKVWGKFADGDSSDAPAVAFAGSVCDVCILAFTGVDETTPIDAHWNNHDEDQTDPYTLNDVVISNDGSACVAASLTIFGNGGSAPDLSSDGYTLRTQSADDAFAVWTGEFDASTDGGVASLDFGSGGATRSGNFVIALKPAAGGGGATYTLTADAGSFAISGTAASLEVSRLIEAETGAVAIAGVAASLIVFRVLSAEAGSFAIAGTDAGLIASRVLNAEPGSFAIAGTDADLIYTPMSGPDYTLSADPGSVAISGTAASLIASRKLTAEPGAIAIGGADAGLKASRKLSAEPDSILINGTDVQLKASRVLACLPGLIQISGTAADLVWSGETPTAPSGVFLSRENQFHRLFFTESKNKQRLFSPKLNKKQRLFE